MFRCRRHWSSGTLFALTLLAPIFFAGRSTPVSAQDARPAPTHSPDGLWELVDPGEVRFPRDFRPPSSFTALRLDLPSLEALLEAAPRETFGSIPPTVEISVPFPDGGFGTAHVVRTEMMEGGLAVLFPEIRTYLFAAADGSIGGHMVVGPGGLQAAGRLGADLMWIEPVETDLGPLYLVSLDRAHAAREEEVHNHPEEVPGSSAPAAAAAAGGFTLVNANAATIGESLRIYRLAAATTGDLYQARGGDDLLVVFSILADLIGTNAVFEPDLGVRLVLSSATFDLLYDDPATDPFDNDPPRCSGSGDACTVDDDCPDDETCVVRTPCQLRGDNSDNMVALHGAGIVDESEYDLGVLFAVSHPGARGGCAWYNVCETDAGPDHKGACAVTAGGNPTGTNGVSGTLAHEVGHQLGARHTFTGKAGSCTLNEFLAGADGANQTGYEPGSGTTRMSYLGSCDDPEDDEGNPGADDNVDTSADPDSDPYFHARSFEEIVDTVFVGTGATCGTLVGTANLPPMIDAGSDYTIPRRTPFTLTAASWSDDQPLTFTWEQYDLATLVTGEEDNDARRPIDTDLGDGPIIRSMPPSPEPSRTIPRLQDLLDGVANPAGGLNRRGELLPQIDRTMTFRVTARDHQMGGGGVASDEMILTVVGAPFFISSPNAGAFPMGCPADLTWNVGGGSVADTVTATFSHDGGQAFDLPLAQSVPNDGHQAFAMPCQTGAQGRIKLAGDGNIFFDVNDEDLTVFPVEPVVEDVEANGGSVDDACEFTVEFAATVTHECSVTADAVDVQLHKEEDNFTLGVPTIQVEQVAPNLVTVQGSVVVSALESSPAKLAVVVTATDACGETDSDFAEAEVVDDTPPEIAVELSPTALWPPNHKMVPITAAVIATDNCPGVQFALVNLVSDEPDDALADGATTADIQDAAVGAPDTSFRLRAERSALGDGRLYTATYAAMDGSENFAEDSATVAVPLHP